VGRFRHLRTGVELHLVPGGPALAPFLVGRFPVRQAEWDRVGGRDARAQADPDLPVTGVSWLAAQAWLARAGDGLRLPREAEWEHACRAGSAGAWFWGDAFDPAWCWCLDNAGGRPHACAEHAGRANAFGLVDMAGNVSEWCQDERLAPAEGGDYWQEWDPGRVHRGGSFDQPASRARSDARGGCAPDRAWPDLGLRVFRSV
jgi:formylglycine-generating enzyme required for sulfatase activity